MLVMTRLCVMKYLYNGFIKKVGLIGLKKKALWNLSSCKEMLWYDEQTKEGWLKRMWKEMAKKKKE